jgi:uncharacterized membrane protein
MNPSTHPNPGRLPSLELARTLAVVTMVLGHTLDALLSHPARATPLISAYWPLRGLTAPLFLTLSGLAFGIWSRSSDRQKRSYWNRAGWALWLLSLGYALRFPAWDLAGLMANREATLRHFLAFDALHSIGASLLLAIALAISISHPSRRACLLAAGAAASFALGGSHLVVGSGSLGILLEQALGGTSPFPIVPWTGFFLAGAALGTVRPGLLRSPSGRLAVTVGGGALVLLALGLGTDDLPPHHGRLALFRLGMVVLLVSGLAWVPAGASAWFARLGRRSLSIYLLHLVAIYGCLTWPGLANTVGPSLTPLEALGVTAVLLLACVLASEIARGSWRATAGARTRAMPFLLGGATVAACAGSIGLMNLLDRHPPQPLVSIEELEDPDPAEEPFWQQEELEELVEAEELDSAT